MLVTVSILLVLLGYFYKKFKRRKETLDGRNQQNGSNFTDSSLSEDVEYELVYGEPPPSYKVAKFYPKAPSNNLNQSDTENIYENIDENLNKCQPSQQHTTLNSPMNASSKRSKFQGLKKPLASSSPSSSRNTNTNCSRQLKNSNNEISRGLPISHDNSYQSVPIRKKRSTSPTNSSKLSITLSTSSGSSSSQKLENKNLIKNNNYNSLSRFKMNNEQFL